MKKIILFTVLLAGILFLMTATIVSQQEKRRAVENLKAMNSELVTYKKNYNDALHTISVKEAVILSEKEAKKALLLENKELKALRIKSVKTQAALEATISILKDSLKAKPGTIIEYVKDTSGAVGIKLPFEYEYKDKYATLSAGVDTNRIPHISSEIYLDGKLIIGFQRDGLFKTKPVGAFTTDNPYVRIQNITPVIIQEKSKWYEKWWVHTLSGAIATYTLIKILK